MEASGRHVAVLGAGVIGLRSAISLLQAGFSVTVVAEHFPGDQSLQYTSPWAGAHWRTHATDSLEDEEQREWDIETYATWSRTLSTPTNKPGFNSSLAVYDSLNYWDTGVLKRDPWWVNHVTDYQKIDARNDSVRNISSSEHEPQIEQAAVCKSFAINVPVHLSHLKAEISRLGGHFVRATLRPHPETFAAALEGLPSLLPNDKAPPAVVVNATGLGARALCHDEAMHPTKGQTVLVRGEASAIRTRQGADYIAYVIPRPGSGTTILGGTKEVGCGDGVVDEEVTRLILDRTRRLAPELLVGGEFDVISAQVGLRPSRHGGARVEIEDVYGSEAGLGRGCKVVHAYGHGGAGYQNSIGVANKVVRLVHQALR